MCGYSTGPTGASRDFVTIKYNADGDEQWKKIYDNNGKAEEARAITVDNKGFVYVTGFTRNANAFPVESDYLTIKMDAADGKIVDGWPKIFDDPTTTQNLDDEAIGLAVGPKGDVYVTGFVNRPDSLEDWATVKYQGNGTFKWVQYVTGSTAGKPDKPADIAVDSSDYVFVTGHVGNVAAGHVNADYATVSYVGNDGTQRWLVFYYGAFAGSDDAATALGLDMT